MSNKLFLIILAFCFSFASCHTMKQTVVKEKNVPIITEGKLLKNIDDHQLMYNTLFAKRINVKLNNGKKENSLRGSLKIKRDSFIQISVNAPLGIEVARVLFTPDSVKFVDMHNKKYFISDYNYFYDQFDVVMDYNYLQKIFTNGFLKIDLGGPLENVKRYKLGRTSAGYELSVIEEKALGRKIKKLYKKKRKNKDFILVQQKFLIDPISYRPLSFLLEDIEEGMGINVLYDSFKNYGERVFPEILSFNIFSDNENITLKLEFEKLEFDVPVKSNLKISSKYKKLHFENK